MKFLVPALVLGIAAAPRAAAAIEARILTLHGKAAIAIAGAAVRRLAPFAAPPVAERPLDLAPRPAAQQRSRSSCAGTSALCYDPAGNHIVYKPARALMPGIPGFTPENISVRRDRIVLRYSF